MNFHIHELAIQELYDSALFYDSEDPGLGDSFLDEFESAITRIKRHPQAWPLFKHEIRAIQFERFDHRVFYRLDGDMVYVVAVAHCAREPLYWIDRT